MYSPFVCPDCNASRRGLLRLMGGAGLALAGGLSAKAQDAPYKRPAAVKQAIDFHAHMWDRGLLERGDVKVRPPEAIARRFLDPQAHIDDMDRFGVDMHVITMSNSIHGISWGDAKSDLAVHRSVNENIAHNWAEKYPKRFVGTCTVPLQDLKLAIPEMERARKQLNARVVQVPTVTPDGVYLSDPSVRDFWTAAEELGLVVFVHPHGNSSAAPLDKYLLFSSVGQPIEEAKLMSAMIYEGILEKHPKLKVVVAHGGGFLPHYTGRMDRNIDSIEPGSRGHLTKPPSAYLKDFYYDSAVYGPQILDALAKIVGPDRIVMGADYPINMNGPIGELQKCTTLSDADIAMITGTTPARLLGL